MNTPVNSCAASVDGLGKKNDRFSFILGIPPTMAGHCRTGALVQVNGVEVLVTDFDGEYLSFDLPYEDVCDSALAEVEVGSEVVVVLC